MDYKILILRNNGEIDIEKFSSPVTAKLTYDIRKENLIAGEVIRLMAFGKTTEEFDSEVKHV